MHQSASYAAQFSDGRSAGRVEARLTLAPGRLEVWTQDGRLLAGWRYKDVRLQMAARPDEPLRLSSATDPDARLTVLNQQAALEIQRGLSAIDGGSGSRWRTAGWLAAAALGAVAVAWGLYAALPLVSRPIARAIPLAWEDQLGDGVVQSQLAGKRSCGGADGMTALNGLLQEIVSANTIDRRFILHVVHDNTRNAFALPGGHIVLLSGLLDDLHGPDELSGVLAHEMSHVLERHITERLVRATGVGLLFTWVTGDPSSLIAGAGSLLVNLSYSRSDEAEADARGVALLERAGFATSGLASFFLRMEEHQGKGDVLPQLLSTHPRSVDRAAYGGKDGRQPLTAAQWQAIKEMCREKSVDR